MSEMGKQRNEKHRKYIQSDVWNVGMQIKGSQNLCVRTKHYDQIKIIIMVKSKHL
jgi:hypothetical protein